MKQNIHILLVEDNDLDAYIANHMLLSVCDDCQITRFSNGVQAVEYLKKESSVNSIVIVLDLNMPLMNGLEFLEEINRNENLKKLKVTVLTSSTNPSDMAFCEDFGVCKYFVKPLTEETSNEIIGLVKVA